MDAITSKPSSRLFVFTCIVLILYVSFTHVRRYYARYRFARLHGCRPTRSYTLDPFLGLDKLPSTISALSKYRILEKGCELFREYGNSFILQELHRSIILTNDPENIKTVLALRFQDYGVAHRLDSFRPLLGQGIFDTDGEHWAASRALIRPSLNRDQIADLSLFEDLIQDLFAIIPSDGVTEVDLQDLFFRYTIDSATEFLFGHSVGTLKTQAEEGFAEAFHCAQSAIIFRATLGPFRIFYRNKKADRSNHICRDFARRFVEQACQDADQKNKFTDELPDRQNARYIIAQELAMRTKDKERILDELMNVLLAGRDTTASLLSNMFFMLAKNPAIWEKIRLEVAILDGRIPTYEELRSLKYTHCCMNESLRLHPVVPRNDRQALQDTVLPHGGGPNGLFPVFVPKGTVVSYNLYAMHRRQDIYGPDADVFRPERWEDGKLQPRWGYLPFNGGPRICIGQCYALTEVGYVLVRMAQRFATLQSRDPGPWVESLALTMSSRNGVKVRLARK